MIDLWPTFNGDTVISDGWHQIVVPKGKVGDLATKLEQIAKDDEYTKENDNEADND